MDEDEGSSKDDGSDDDESSKETEDSNAAKDSDESDDDDDTDSNKDDESEGSEKDDSAKNKPSDQSESSDDDVYSKDEEDSKKANDSDQEKDYQETTILLTKKTQMKTKIQRRNRILMMVWTMDSYKDNNSEDPSNTRIWERMRGQRLRVARIQILMILRIIGMLRKDIKSLRTEERFDSDKFRSLVNMLRR